MTPETLPATAVAPKKKHAGGRPTKYKPEYCQAIVDFFDVPAYEKVLMEERSEHYADGTEKALSRKYTNLPNKMPTLYRFARSIGVNQSTLGEWRETYPEFSTAFEHAKELVKEFVITNGMAGNSPPAFAIFVAKNVTDMKDKVENTFDVNHNIFFVPKEIAEKHKLALPEAIQPRDAQIIDVSSRSADPA